MQAQIARSLVADIDAAYGCVPLLARMTRQATALPAAVRASCC
jgi:hypothetical protein